MAPEAAAVAAVPEHHREPGESAPQQPVEADAATEDDTDDSEDADAREAGQPKNSQQLPEQLKKLKRLRQAYEQRGVVYISRIPPHMVRSNTDPLYSASLQHR